MIALAAGKMLMRERWAWFRIEALHACRRAPRMAAELYDMAGIAHRSPGSRRTTSQARVALRNLSRLVNHGIMERTAGGYRTTPRGARALDDLLVLGLDNADRPAP